MIQVIQNEVYMSRDYLLHFHRARFVLLELTDDGCKYDWVQAVDGKSFLKLKLVVNSCNVLYVLESNNMEKFQSYLKTNIKS